jgi:hypothetical protein
MKPLPTILILINWAGLVAISIASESAGAAIAGTVWAILTLLVVNRSSPNRCKNCD